MFLLSYDNLSVVLYVCGCLSSPYGVCCQRGAEQDQQEIFLLVKKVFVHESTVDPWQVFFLWTCVMWVAEGEEFGQYFCTFELAIFTFIHLLI